MEISFARRRIYPEELRKLDALRKKAERSGGCRRQVLHVIFALFLGAGFAYLAALPPDNFWTWLFGTAAVLAFGFLIFTPSGLYKRKKQHTASLRELKAAIELGTVGACFVHATRIAVADEYEDEGVLYIVECGAHEVLYLWDVDFTLRKSFPCLEFEIYEPDFARILGREVFAQSPRITPVTIDTTGKWNYLSRHGWPKHLSTEFVDFDVLVQSYNLAEKE